MLIKPLKGDICVSLKISPTIKTEVLKLSRVSTLRFVGAALGDWAIISAAIGFSMWMGTWWAYALAAFTIATRQHAFMILVHDAVHFRAHRKMAVNDLLSDLLCAFPIFFDTAIYRYRHLQHHEHLNTDKDPDWTRKQPFQEWAFPKRRGDFISMMSRYIFLGRGTLEWIYAARYFSGFSQIDGFTPKKSSLAIKVGFWCVALATLFATHQMMFFLAYWVVPFYLVFPALQRLRSIAEHFGLTYADELNSSRDIASSWLESFLFAPHGVNWHLSHHLYPSVPFYNLKQLHQALLSDVTFAQTAKINSSYVFPGAKSLWKDILNEEAPKGPQNQTQEDLRPLRKVA